MNGQEGLLVENQVYIQIAIILFAFLAIGTSANAYHKTKGALHSVWLALVFSSVVIAVRSTMSILENLELYDFASWYFVADGFLVLSVLLAMMNLKSVKSSGGGTKKKK